MRKTAIASVLAIAALLAVWTSQASACTGVNQSATSQSADSAKRAITCLINRRRAKHGLKRLHGSYALGSAAQEHSDAMASLNFFAHDGNDGTPTSRAESAGYMSGASAWGLGENLEWASGKAASPRAVVAGWMGSPEHRDVIYSGRFRHVGIGITNGAPVSADIPGAATFTADFGYRKG